jgi:hypothetical protein
MAVGAGSFAWDGAALPAMPSPTTVKQQGAAVEAAAGAPDGAASVPRTVPGVGPLTCEGAVVPRKFWPWMVIGLGAGGGGVGRVVVKGGGGAAGGGATVLGAAGGAPGPRAPCDVAGFGSSRAVAAKAVKAPSVGHLEGAP